jgi:hypothetical protein
MIEGIQTRVYGPKAAETEAAGFVVPHLAVLQLVELFTTQLSQRSGGPVQMLVEVPDVPVSVVNVFRYYGGKAAVAHVLRNPPSGNVPALAGIYVLLPGEDRDADEAAVAAIESSRDAHGRPLPLPPKVYETLRNDVRPLLAMLFFNPEAVTDPSLRMLGVCLAEAYFKLIKPPPTTKTPGTP